MVTHRASSSPRLRRAAVATAGLWIITSSLPSASAADVVWSPAGFAGSGNGTWSAAGNWQNNVLPGTTDVADFGQLDIAADSTVTLDAPQSVNGLVFGDAGGAGTASNWSITGGNVLTLAGPAPSINVVNDTATISSKLGGTAGLTKLGAGTLLLNFSGAEAFTGGLTIAAGVVDVKDQIAALQSGNTLTFAGSGTFALDNNSNAAHSQLLGTLSFSAGEGVIQVGNSTAAQTGTNSLAFASLAPVAAGAVGNFTLGVGTGLSFATDRITFVTPPTVTNGFLSPALFAGGSGYAVYDSTGYVRPLNYGIDANSLAISLTANKATLAAAAGVSVTGKDVGLTGTKAITAQPSETLNSLVVGGTNSITLASGATLTITSGGLLKAGGNAATISGGTALTSGGNELVIRTDASGDKLSISTAVSTSGGLVKAGAGTLVLSNLSNTIGGGIAIDAGTLNITSLSSLGNLGGSKLITFGGGTLQYGTGLTADVSPFLNAFPAGTLAGIDTNGNSVTFTSALAGTGGLSKLGSGTLTLNATNTYAGGTTIAGGTLVFPTVSAVPAAGRIVIGSGGALSVSGAYSTLAGWLGSGQIASSSNGALALVSSSSENFDGTTYNGLSVGAMTGSSITYTGSITPGAGGYFVGGGGGTITIPNPTFSGVNNFTAGNGGGGTVILAAANSFTGNLTVSAGTLQAGAAGALGPGGGGLTLGAGAALDLGGNNLNVSSFNASAGAVITDSSSVAGVSIVTANVASGTSTFTGGIKNGAGGRVLALAKSGGGTIVLNGPNANTFTGGLTIAGGLVDDRTNNANVLPASGEPLVFAGNGTFSASNNSANAVSPVLGAVTLLAGDATIQSNDFANNTTSSQTLAVPSLPARSAGATLNFTLAGTGVTGGTPSGKYQVVLTTAPATGQSLDGGIYYDGGSFAAYDASGYVRALQYATDANAVGVSLAANQSSFGSAVTSGNDVQLTGGGGFAITSQPSVSIRTLRIGDANNLTLATGATLTLLAGGLLKDGGNAAVISGGSLTTGSALDLVVRTNQAADVLTIASTVSGQGGLTKSGPGVLALTAINAFSGPVWVNGGLLRAADGGGLPSAANLTLDGGVLETAGVVNRAIGTGAGGIQLSGAFPGFSANGGSLVVDLSGAAAAAGYTVSWGTTGFAPAGLILDAPTAAAPLTFANSLDLNTSGFQTISVGTNVATIAGNVSATGGGGLIKAGAGTLSLTGSLTYAGGTTISNGAVQLPGASTLPKSGNLNFAAASGTTAMLETSGSLTLPLGTGSGQVQFSAATGSNGFSAVGGPLSVTITNATQTLVYAQSPFQPNTFVLNDVNATGPITLADSLDVNGGTHAVGVYSTSNGAVITGGVTNSGTAAGTFSKVGPGSLQISGALTDGTKTLAVSVGAGTLVFGGNNKYSGGTTINSGATLVANTAGPGSSAAGSGPVTVSSGGTLAGSGTIAGFVTISTGAILSAGDGSTTPGMLTLAATSGNSLADGSEILWKINNVGSSGPGSAVQTSGAGAPGASVGWDSLAFASLTTGTAAGVDVIPLNVGSTPVAGFNPAATYQWTIATLPGNGQALAANFHLDANALGNFAAANGADPTSFTIGGDAGDIYISYAPNPEPGSLATLAGGAAGLLLRRRRRSVVSASHHH
jgi:fibronectin-binding autotransporter adhesin